MSVTTRLATFEDVPALQALIAASARGLSEGEIKYQRRKL